jgi:hypothetical protein
MNLEALLVELLLSGFFAVACFRAKADSIGMVGVAPARLFVLVDRLERLRRTRWQWFSMVLVLVLVRLQMQTPMMIELTGLAQFVVFLALPASKPVTVVLRRS